jgi:hypothetical protein
MKFYSATKKNEILWFAGKWMDIILNKVIHVQSPKAACFLLYIDYSRRVKVLTHLKRLGFEKSAPGYPTFSHPSTQAIAPWSKEAWLLLALVADLGIIYEMLGFRHAEYKSYRVMEASIQISKEGLRGQAMCSRSRFL